MFSTACASAGSSPVEATVHSAAAAEAESDSSHVRFVDSDGLLACAWNEADAIFERAMSQLGPALERCANEEGRITSALWVLWVNVGPDGEIERAWVPVDGSRVAMPETSGRPPACVLEALNGFRLESGPPSCGSVHILRFEVEI